ncbi:hypothetical protein YC2023_016330 [Brassica napus]
MLFLTFEYEIKNISLFFLFARQICYGKRKDLQRRRRERTRRQNQKQKKRREQRRMRRSCQRRRTQLLLRFLALISFETSCLVQFVLRFVMNQFFGTQSSLSFALRLQRQEFASAFGGTVAEGCIASFQYAKSKI